MTVPEARLLRLLKEARERLESERRQRTEPIAIVGMGCRFPGGVSTPSEFWDSLVRGVDATSDVPADRWDAEALYDADATAPGKCYAKRGGFLDRIDGFDPEFFGISPREAVALDPQQRLLLEVTWEALEDSGISPTSLRNTNAGVWVGLSLDDYSGQCMPQGQLERIDAYTALGNARSVAAGRIAYVLGLHGPVMQLDTACSSSLVAVHLACQSLRAGECELALVGGVNVMSSPEASVALCKMQALSRDGRCKTFDASADGYGRAEGCGVLVLKTLSAAEAAGDRIYGIVRGSAVNHDGPSNGLTAPNGFAQEAVLRSALANAAVSASEVSYVEAHGTGTLLGDPIEVMALSRVYGVERQPEEPLLLGSVKTNLGHLEAAAGVAALIKTALCLFHSTLVSHLHFVEPNPRIPWASLAVGIVRENRAWPIHAARRLAGVSSFGISGTNAHVVLEGASAPERAAPATRSAELIVLSGKTEVALRRTAIRLQAHLEQNPALNLADVGYSLLSSRSSMPFRKTFAVPSVAALRDALSEYSENAALPEVSRSSPARPKVAFVFPGQGSQWLGMARELLREEPAFQGAFESCDRAISEIAGWSVLRELQATPELSRMECLEVVQPMLFAIQVALTAVWRSWGIEPDVVVGHSMGEIAAAFVAGALSLADAVSIVCRRSALLQQISGQGEMALVGVSFTEAEAALVGLERSVSAAASNSRQATVLSGNGEALAAVIARLEARGVFCRRVKVDVASHSPQVDRLLPELMLQLAAIAPRAAELPIHSTVTGERLDGPELGASYWADNLRKPVRFAESIERLVGSGIRCFVEISPHPLLVSGIDEIGKDAGVDTLAVASLYRERPERQSMLSALGSLHESGLPLHTARLYPEPRRKISLPTTPWQHTRYWVDRVPYTPPSRPSTLHPLLGSRLAVAGKDAIYEACFGTSQPPYLSEHRVLEQVIAPGAALLELMRAAFEDFRARASFDLHSIVWHAPLVLREGSLERIQVVLSDGGKSGSVYSQPAEADAGRAWILHASAECAPMADAERVAVDVDMLRNECTRPLDVEALYASYGHVGVNYGPSFRGLKRVWCGPFQVFAELELDPALTYVDYGLHPALLDAAFQAIGGLFAEAPDAPWLPFELGSLSLYRAGQRASFLVARLAEPARADGCVAHLTLFDAFGAVIAELRGMHARRADTQSLKNLQLVRNAGAADLYRLHWQDAPAPAAQRLSGTFAILATRHEPFDRALIEQLQRRGASARLETMDDLQRSEAEHVVCVWRAGQTDGESSIANATRGLAIVQAVSARSKPPRLWWFSQRSGASPSSRVAAASGSVWGLGRTVRLEYPELRCTLIDFDSDADIVEALATELRAPSVDEQIAYTGGRRAVPRLMRDIGLHSLVSGSESGLPHSTALITGGLSGVGACVAVHLARRGVGHLLLVGRRGASTPGASELLAQIRACGARVTAVAADVSELFATLRLTESIPDDLPLKIVVHAAAVFADAPLALQNGADFDLVMRPKVLGAWNLDRLTRESSLDAFVLFSSLSGVLGSPAQGAYAAANAFLDSLARERNGRGLPGLSLAWGPWAEYGHAAAMPSALRERLTERGVSYLEPSAALALFDRALRSSEPTLIAAAFAPSKSVADDQRRARTFPSERPMVRAPLVFDESRAWREEWRKQPPEARPQAALRLVCSQVARVLRLTGAHDVPADEPLRALGLDSLMAVELRNALAQITGTTLPGTLTFNQPTARSLARYLAEQGSELARDESSPVHGSTAWGEKLNVVLQPRMRLICFHEAGGTAQSFMPLGQLESSGIEVHAISHTRREPPRPASASRYLREAVDYVRALGNAPYCAFGHSLGGYFAWRVIQELTTTGHHSPSLFFPSAAVMPWPPQSTVSAAEAAAIFNQITPVQKRTPAAKEAFTSDVALWCAMPEAVGRALDVPIFAFVGANDPLADAAGMKHWSERTAAGYQLTVLPGAHFYLEDEASREKLVHALRERMCSL